MEIIEKSKPSKNEAVCSAAFIFLSVTMTRAPSLAKIRHVAFPMPLPAPEKGNKLSEFSKQVINNKTTNLLS